MNKTAKCAMRMANFDPHTPTLTPPPPPPPHRTPNPNPNPNSDPHPHPHLTLTPTHRHPPHLRHRLLHAISFSGEVLMFGALAIRALRRTAGVIKEVGLDYGLVEPRHAFI
jgi:hypothetical protein